VTSATQRLNGRVAVSTRALERTVTAVAATRLGVPFADVSVRLVDDAGLLGIAITGPLRLPPLRSPAPTAGALTRIAEARAQIRDDVTRIAGAQVRTVTVAITRAVVQQERRVR
jgi:hypothetical protein